MASWNQIFKRFKGNSEQQAADSAEGCAYVSLKQLIAQRFNSSGLSLSSRLSKHKRSQSSLSGSHHSPFKGRGLDFDEVRPYQAGDDIRNIDWNVTARTNRVHTKVFKEERERPIFLVVDLNPSMQFATRGKLKSVQAAHLAALCAWVGANEHNRIGGVLFSQQKQIELRPVGGHRGVLKFFNQLVKAQHQALDSMLGQQPMENAETEPYDCLALFSRLNKIIRPGSLIIFISDFAFLSEQQWHQFHYMARHNDLIASFIYDPFEVDLPPPGEYLLTNYAANKQMQMNTQSTAFRQHYRQQFIERDAKLEAQFNKIGAHFLRLASNEECFKVLSQSLGVSSRHARIAKSYH